MRRRDVDPFSLVELTLPCRFTSLLEKVAGPQTGEGKNEKARKDAEAAEERCVVVFLAEAMN